MTVYDSSSQAFTDCTTLRKRNFCGGELVLLMLDSLAGDYLFLAFSKFTRYTEYSQYIALTNDKKLRTIFQFWYTQHILYHTKRETFRRHRSLTTSLSTWTRLTIKFLWILYLASMYYINRTKKMRCNLARTIFFYFKVFAADLELAHGAPLCHSTPFEKL